MGPCPRAKAGQVLASGCGVKAGEPVPAGGPAVVLLGRRLGLPPAALAVAKCSQGVLPLGLPCGLTRCTVLPQTAVELITLGGDLGQAVVPSGTVRAGCPGWALREEVPARGGLLAGGVQCALAGAGWR